MVNQASAKVNTMQYGEDVSSFEGAFELAISGVTITKTLFWLVQKLSLANLFDRFIKHTFSVILSDTSSLHLLGDLFGFIVSLLSADHDSESIEVVGGSFLVVSVHLLECWGGGPLGIKIESFGGLHEGTGSGSLQQW